jgi:hypothetical protein
MARSVVCHGKKQKTAFDAVFREIAVLRDFWSKTGTAERL